jgi:hypothetical protein
MKRDDLPRGTRQLRAGDYVEVRSEAEILATLDAQGTIDGLPFMPEMLAFAGRRLTVDNRADTTCFMGGLWDMDATVHLTAARCDGSAHGGCQANCLLFWKEEWLRPVDSGDQRPAATRQPATRDGAARADLVRATHQPGSPLSGPEERWSCQNTQLREASTRIAHWDLRHFVRDVRNGNVPARTVLRQLLPYLIDIYQGVTSRRLPHWLLIRGGAQWPAVHGPLTRTPARRLDLQPGEQVRVRSRQEIRQTVDRMGRNRGLSFDTEMTPYCGSSMTVDRRVDRIIDDWTGRMLEPKTPCIVLEGAECKGLYHGLCTRRTDTYWREIWLEREAAAGAPAGTRGLRNERD